MNVSIRQLRAFATIAETGSFAEAAERMHLTQPALSVSIRNMEEAVGGALFSRSTRSLELTPEGRAFLPVALRLLSDWDRGFEDLRRRFALQQGSISIAVMPSFAMNQFPNALLEFSRRYPSINITVEDIVMEHVLDAVREGRVDLGITFEPEQLEGVDFIPLFTDRFIAVLPPQHPLAEKPRLRWRQLEGSPMITMNRGSWWRQRTEQALQQAGIRPRRLSEANQLATIGRMVAVGLGIATVPGLCRDQMESMGAVCKPLSHPVMERRVGVFSRRRHPLSGAALQMREVLLQTFQRGRGLEVLPEAGLQ